MGWYDTKLLVNQMKAAGGEKTNQWEIPWDPENAAGSCTLIDMESLDGRHHKFLLDSGCNTQYMDKCYQREGIDKMIESGEIEFLIIGHEHKIRPQIYNTESTEDTKRSSIQFPFGFLCDLCVLCGAKCMSSYF